jgi:uncharacterized protein (DUF4415 family)
MTKPGPKPKPPGEKKVKRLITLDHDLSEKAKATGNRSGLINKLLRQWAEEVGK